MSTFTPEQEDGIQATREIGERVANMSPTVRKQITEDVFTMINGGTADQDVKDAMLTAFREGLGIDVTEGWTCGRCGADGNMIDDCKYGHLPGHH